MYKRLFLALNLPADLKEKLFALVLKLQKINNHKPIKWVEENNFHLTWHFLGNVELDKIPLINDSLSQLISNYSPLKLQISPQINAFPNLNNPQIIFLEITDLNHHLITELHRKTGKTLHNFGFIVDQRPLRLHLTLGRVKLKTAVQLPSAPVISDQFTINSLDLMASQLTAQGPIYQILSSYKLSF